jgi:uncharacterized protein (DUF433 family)
MDYRKIITVDPKVRNGQPCVRGMPITVSEVLAYLASGMPMIGVIEKHPELSSEDVKACLAFAADGG